MSFALVLHPALALRRRPFSLDKRLVLPLVFKQSNWNRVLTLHKACVAVAPARPGHALRAQVLPCFVTERLPKLLTQNCRRGVAAVPCVF